MLFFAKKLIFLVDKKARSSDLRYTVLTKMYDHVKLKMNHTQAWPRGNGVL
jgi:hypothetical protein